MSTSHLPAPPGRCEYGIWLEAPSISGGKAWVAFRTMDTVETFWGKKNQINQSPHKLELNRSSPRFVLDDLFRQKRNKGYVVMGEWLPNSGWSITAHAGRQGIRAKNQQRPLPPPQSPPPEQTPKKESVSRKLPVSHAVTVWRNTPIEGTADTEWF